jgi:hypothetical protein
MRTALLACGLALALAGCAMAPMGKPVPSMENIGKARGAGLPPMALGSFTLAPGKEPSLDQKVSIRTNTIYSPFESSFAAYLKETLAADLRAAGLLDAQSPVVVGAQLTDSQISVPVGEASATIAARFTVSRAGAPVYAKELRARSEWKAEFNGFEALPMAVNRYEQLYRQLTAALLDDAEFRAAVKR